MRREKRFEECWGNRVVVRPGCTGKRPHHMGRGLEVLRILRLRREKAPGVAGGKAFPDSASERKSLQPKGSCSEVSS